MRFTIPPADKTYRWHRGFAILGFIVGLLFFLSMFLILPGSSGFGTIFVWLLPTALFGGLTLLYAGMIIRPPRLVLGQNDFRIYRPFLKPLIVRWDEVESFQLYTLPGILWTVFRPGVSWDLKTRKTVWSKVLTRRGVLFPNVNGETLLAEMRVWHKQCSGGSGPHDSTLSPGKSGVSDLPT